MGTEELTAVLRRMRLPYVRRAAPEVLAVARAQPWDPAEVLRVLIAAEIAGRDTCGCRKPRSGGDQRIGGGSAAWLARSERRRPRPSLHKAPMDGQGTGPNPTDPPVLLLDQVHRPISSKDSPLDIRYVLVSFPFEHCISSHQRPK